MNIFTFSQLTLALTALFLGILMLFKSKGDKTIRMWAIFCFFVVIWGFGSFRLAFLEDSYSALIWWKITYIGIIFIPVLFYHFVYLFLNLKKRVILYLFYLYSIFFVILEWTPWADLFFGLDNISFLFNSLYWIFPPTVLFTFFVFSWFYIVIHSHLELISVFRVARGLKHVQIKYIFIGMAIAFIGGGLSFLPCFGIELYPFLNILAPLYPIIITYAVVRHRLLDVKFVLRKSLVYVGSLSTIFISAITIEYFTNIYLFEYKTLVDVLILIAAVTAFIPIKNFFYHFANKWFFSSLYDSKDVITDLSEKLRTTLEVKKVYKHIANTLFDTFHTKAAGILLYDEKTGDYLMGHNKGFRVGQKKKFPGNKEMYNLFVKKNKPIVTEEVKTLAYRKYKETIDLMEKFGVEMLIPLNVKDKNIGLLVLSDKESGDMYNNEDLSLLEVISAQSAIAIENALLYDETKKFADKLKKEVADATAGLQKANIELKKLDEAKSEFMSIASHQLRTPLTVIKGYISMMLEGTFGKLTSGGKSSLNKVYDSNERLIKLVEDFLSVSRIESGRLQFNYEVMQLEEVAESVVDELTTKAEEKGLKLIYQKLDKPLVKVKIDKDKIRQVIMNLIDNSIKYTQKGKIEVNLWQGKKYLHFCVEDTGMGITKDNMVNLFKKFSRGKGTSVIYTEGTGLGLYVGKQMVKVHKGKIWAESKGKDKGSKFCFIIPIK